MAGTVAPPDTGVGVLVGVGVVLDVFVGVGEVVAVEFLPTAYIFLKAILEYPKKYGQRLRADVERWGNWIVERLREDVGEESILVDFCSGKRALTAVFTLLNLRSIVKAVAVDVEEPHPYLKNYRDLHYVRKSLFSKDIVDALKKHLDDKPVYGVGIHCCGELSIKAIDLAAELNIGKLYLMPCCLPRKRIEGMETYRDWVEYLARYGEGKGFTAESIEEIKWLLTDKNILITLASKPRVPQ